MAAASERARAAGHGASEPELGSHGPRELARAARPWHRRASARQPCLEGASSGGAAMVRAISSWASMVQGARAARPWRGRAPAVRLRCVPALDPPLGAALTAGQLRALRRRRQGTGSDDCKERERRGRMRWEMKTEAYRWVHSGLTMLTGQWCHVGVLMCNKTGIE